MDIYVCRRLSKSGNSYLSLEARAPWGIIRLCVEASKILQVIPNKVDHRTLDEKGVKVGRLD